VQRASVVVELLDRALRLWIDESVSRGSFEADTEWLDDASRAAWIAMAKEKRRWLTVDKGVLAVELPLSNACAARLLAELNRQASQSREAADLWAAIPSHLSELELDHGRLRAAWKLDGPTLTYEPEEPGSPSSPWTSALNRSLELPSELPSLEDVIAAFRKP
jgi:hypothetical protein